MDDHYMELHHLPGEFGSIFTEYDSPMDEIPDEELFDPALYPITATEMNELEQVDEVNEILAELDLLESHQELYYKLNEKTHKLRSSSDVDAEIYSLMTKSALSKSFFLKPESHSFMKLKIREKGNARTLIK
ncbi:uncharacterized protein CCR75_002952 [Bremia lactucae]|uniref:Uncharacterized protein n=1 Tax=Bremia lactucae TaxID=4779 RepID=A0A976NZK0_BRELC|nr:hypothetical protein CCR75_002952 [Bremia lactucae]